MSEVNGRVVTGRTAEKNHVRPMDDAAIYRSMYSVNLPYAVFRGEGGQFNAVLNEYELTIYTGILQMQGYVVRLDTTATDIPLDPADPGTKRMDLAVMEYRMEQAPEEEYEVAVAELKILKGTNYADSVDVLNDRTKWPALTTGDIDAGETHQVMLWGIYHRLTTGGTATHTLVDLRQFTSNVNIANLSATVASHTASISTLTSSLGTLQNNFNSLADKLRYSSGETLIISNYYCAGYITTSSTQLYFFIPTKYIDGSITLFNMSVAVRHSGGGYVYKPVTKTSTSATALNTTSVTNIATPLMTPGVEKVTCNKLNGGIQVIITFVGQLTAEDKRNSPKSDGTCSNHIKNNIPITATVKAEFAVL